VTAVLRTKQLSRRYGHVWGLRDCTLELPEGSVTALIGANGAGKSTLLHLIVGLIAPTSGSVFLFGKRGVSAAPPQLAQLAQVGFVAQDHPLYSAFTVADLLRMGRGLNPRWDQAFAEQRLKRLAIPLERRSRNLSGGQQAQVALTMALAKRPRLLVLDEPVASLDPLARREFMKGLLEAVAGGGLTVLMSSHVVSELERVCDHVVLLRDGRVQLAGEIDALLACHRLLVGPRGASDANAVGSDVVRVEHSDRHTRLLVKGITGATWHPRWNGHAVGFEELVLAYLEEPRDRAVAGAPSPRAGVGS
jgi:ABC-2 type transport system ATP-binding protein